MPERPDFDWELKFLSKIFQMFSKKLLFNGNTWLLPKFTTFGLFIIILGISAILGRTACYNARKTPKIGPWNTKWSIWEIFQHLEIHVDRLKIEYVFNVCGQKENWETLECEAIKSWFVFWITAKSTPALLNINCTTKDKFSKFWYRGYFFIAICLRLYMIVLHQIIVLKIVRIVHNHC